MELDVDILAEVVANKIASKLQHQCVFSVEERVHLKDALKTIAVSKKVIISTAVLFLLSIIMLVLNLAIMHQMSIAGTIK